MKKIKLTFGLVGVLSLIRTLSFIPVYGFVTKNFIFVFIETFLFIAISIFAYRLFLEEFAPVSKTEQEKTQ